MIARQPTAYAQRLSIVPALRRPEEIAAQIASRVNALVADPVTVAAAILLPSVTTLELLTKVALALNDQALWKVATSHLQTTPAGAMVAFHIVREIPFGADSCPSEALVLGPFSDFPTTRRAPITALEIYVGGPRPTDPKMGSPTTKANLAHMEMHMPTQQ